jgi:nucleotide-binding universal stress UspA family protein
MIKQQLHHRPSRSLDLLSDRRSLGAGQGLLVAVENTGLERGVLSVAELLARRDQINVHLIGVSNPVTRSRAVTTEERADLTEARLRRVHQTTRQLLHTTVGRGAYWSIDAALGTLPTVMAEEARKRAPRLLMVALEESGDERTRQVDTIVRAATMTGTPVLAVPAHQQLLPTKVLIATDFSAASRHAARTSLALLGNSAQLTLLHVEPELDYVALGHPAWHDKNTEGVARLFAQLQRELEEEALARDVRLDVVPHSLTLRGDSARMILEYAERESSALIVMGFRSAPHLASRSESIAASVLRDARTSVLVAPARATAA